MEQLVLSFGGEAISYHPLRDAAFWVGTDPACDLVLAGDKVAQRHLQISRGGDGQWRARSGLNPSNAVNLSEGRSVKVGAYSLTLQTRSSESPARRVPHPVELPKYGIVGHSFQTAQLIADIDCLGPMRGSVLIYGETGTGKELVARGLWEQFRGTEGPFVAVNCGALADSLLEDTLFGHERGAFTGAAVCRKGLFEQAAGGTLFLDEIGELRSPHQAALLRVLDSGEVRRIGGENARQVDFRLIAATNRNLAQQVEEGAFRRDLYHRISTLQIETSPLRKRPDDIGPLSRHFLWLMAHEVGERDLSPEASELLASHAWPGNARELYNALYRAAVSASGKTIRRRDFELNVERPRPSAKQHRDLADLSDRFIADLVARHSGNIAAAARALSVARTTLRDRVYRIGQLEPKRQNVINLPVERLSEAR